MRAGVEWKRLEIICIIIVAVLLGLITRGFYQQETDTAQKSYRSLNSGWFQMRDGERIDLSLPCSVTADSDGKVVLYNDTLTADDSGEMLSVSGLQYNLKIRMGEKLLYHYQDNDFPRNAQMKGKIWADICLPDSTGNEMLCLIYESDAGSQLYLQTPVLGDSQAVFAKHLENAAFSVLMILGMLGLSILSIFVFCYTGYRQITEKKFLDVAFFLVLCSLWCIFDSGLYQMYGKQNEIGTLISVYAFMLMSVPMLHFVQNIVSDRLRWIPRMWIFFFYINAVLQGIVYFLFRFPFTRMLFITHMVLFIGTVSMIVLLWREYKRKQSQELMVCFGAFSALGISGVAALALYWFFSIYWYDVIFEFGILLYVGILFAGLLHKVSGDIRFRLELAVYERMAMEDRMTGLKNRESFEQYLEGIQEEYSLIDNALLLFIDISSLKNINDMYGWQVGDEAVVRTARSIRQAGNITEQKVECFRIEGDEFAIIIMNPILNPEEVKTYIKDEMKKEIGSRYYVYLKFGYSYLRKADGTFNSISDWKRQADMMLYSSSEIAVEEKYDL